MAGVVVAFALSFIPAWIFAYIVYWLDRFEREPKKLLVVVFAWGALLAALGAVVVEFVLSEGTLTLTGNKSLTALASDAFYAPVVEESLKGLAILIVLIVFYSEFDSVLDGIVYAGIVALGFAATEDWFYLSSGYLDEGWSSLFGLFVLRVILTGWNHPAFTAFIGIGLALARGSPYLPVKLAAPIAGWGIAVLLHGTYNALVRTESGGGFLLALCVTWTGWLAIFGVILLALRTERARARLYLKDEVERGTLSAAQYRAACSILGGTFTRLSALGSGHYWDTRRFYQVCGELAQKKEQLLKSGDERGNAAAIEQLRGELTRLSPAAKA